MTKRSKFNIDPVKVRKLNAIFEKFKPFLPKAYHNISISVVFTDAPQYTTSEGGYAVDFTIAIGSVYLNEAPDDIAIAEILGHELGHQVLGHMSHPEDYQSVQAERDADHFGMFLCELAGFSRISYINWFKKFEKARNKGLSENHVDEHGTGEQRIKQLEEQDDYMQGLEDC